MDNLTSIEQAEHQIRQYSDFLSDAKLAQVYRLVEEYKQHRQDLQAASGMLEEGAPVERANVQVESRDQRILSHIQQILESS